jgi:uncharacterized protein (DUF2164 family)|tara:strand:+ start:4788 stop:4928 length:141 start_codon:yes stop_codon:yes gene_type:complete
MTIKDNIQAQIEKIDAILLLDFITSPVREELTGIKTNLESAKSDLS